MKGGRALFFTLFLSAPAAAEPCSSIARDNIAACAVRASAVVRADRSASDAATGRRMAVDPWFPSNPVVTLTAAQREGPKNAFNYYGTLSQEIQVSGQRSALRRSADAEVDSKKSDLVASTRRAAARGYIAYFDVLASREALDVARRLEATANTIARVTRGRADSGVTSPLDAEAAEASALRVTQLRIAGERDLRTAEARIAALLGRDPLREKVGVTGELVPLRGVEGLVPRERPEIASLVHEREAIVARAEAYRKARFPPLTLQIFAQNDGFNERVLGGGLSVPIPLPQPIGRTYAGEIHESEALAEESRGLAEAMTREFSSEFAVAVAVWETRRAERALYTDERATRSEKLLAELGREIEAGHLAVRDALLVEQQLIDVLRGVAETKHALCDASVDLALAAGIALEGEPR